MKALRFLVVIAVASSCQPGCSDETSQDSGDPTDPSTQAQTIRDLAYADGSSAEVLDIYIPAGTGPFPAVVVIHGGGFFTGDKSAVASSAEYLASQGFVAAAINYRLSGEAVFPAAVHDCKAAVRFLRANASTYRIDVERIGSWGESAGANLASMLGTSFGDAFVEGADLGNASFSSRVTATVSMFAPIDFLTIDSEAAALGFMTNTDDAGSFESQYMGFAVQSDPSTTALANPTTYIDANDAAFLVQAGDSDPLIPYTQSGNFHEALRAVIGDDRAVYDLFPGAGHGGSAFTSDENLAKIASFFRDNL